MLLLITHLIKTNSRDYSRCKESHRAPVVVGVADLVHRCSLTPYPYRPCRYIGTIRLPNNNYSGRIFHQAEIMERPAYFKHDTGHVNMAFTDLDG